LENSVPTPFEEKSLLPESDSFESTFSGLSRVNDSLRQIILVHDESGQQKTRKKPGQMSPKQERVSLSLFVYAFGGSA
jgi:hypothetical protein